ncbi:MarR family transcriptional regulator [Longispora sp. K20-0274]|uniref:MarR family winged helix-turn-helix transcriptional regulator n=1 Tax=Longispora sp. K20-0274 TaxID=3088255 RepID=UPI00399C1FD2
MADGPHDEQLCHGIRRAEQALIARHESVLRAHGLTMAQYMALLALRRSDGGLSGTQLARAGSVTPQTMTTVMNNLLTKGLITREPSPVHAKVLIANLTEKGRTLLDGGYQEILVLERELNAAFTAEEQATLVELLARATTILTRQAEARRAR